MKILLIGSGGREHALAWAISASDACSALYCAPGNAGIESCAECVSIAADDLPALVDFAKKQTIDLVVVGPEAPLVAGLGDALRAEGIAVFGPSRMAARLEGSKGFMKDLCAQYNIPTAAYGRFDDFEKAQNFIQSQVKKLVVKADGLAAGKGVIICNTQEEAIHAARSMLLENSFGQAGAEIVIEEFLEGEEISYFALSDGQEILPFGSAQDHKRALEGDHGPNTGGMGAYAPAHLMTPELEHKILETLIQPTVKAMASEGCPFSGVLFAGIMVVAGEPILLEYNVRFGDPECQALMLRFQGDLLQVLNACAHGQISALHNQNFWHPDPALCVVMAAQGYPGTYKKDTIIKNLGAAQHIEHTMIFHAGTRRSINGEILSCGGRVLNICATGQTIEQAKNAAYAAIDLIDWPEGFCRRDIGWRAIAAEKNKDKAA